MRQHERGAAAARKAAYMEEWHARNPGYAKAYLKAYREKNRDVLLAKKREAHIANREHNLAVFKAYHAANAKKIVARKRARRAVDPKALALHNSFQAARRARTLQATPKWSDAEAIRKLYERAQQLTADTGIKHSVDHIIPLIGKSVSGLHVAENMRVITLSENCSKQNRVVADDMV